MVIKCLCLPSTALARSTQATTLPNVTDIINVSLQATPPAIFPGLTRNLAINCSFKTGTNSNFSDVISLIISKTTSITDDVFTEIADLTSRSHDIAEVKGTLQNVKVTGHLPQQQGDAFLLLEWSNPTAEAEGHYKCEAFGIDPQGHPKSSSMTTDVVAEVEFTPQVLLHELKGLHQSQDELQALKNEVASLKSFQSQITSNVFTASSTFKGHQYLLSAPMVRDIANSDNICRIFGGYLVEINDKAEYDFVHDFAIVKNNVDELAVGVSDAEQEGTWKYIYSGGVAWLLKGDGEQGAGVDCIEIWKSFGAKGMVDEPCVGINQHKKLVSRFMCEMPSQGVTL